MDDISNYNKNNMKTIPIKKVPSSPVFKNRRMSLKSRKKYNSDVSLVKIRRKSSKLSMLFTKNTEYIGSENVKKFVKESKKQSKSDVLQKSHQYTFSGKYN